MAEEVERISAEAAHDRVKANQALLVCAYDDEVKYRMLNLKGSIPLFDFQSRVDTLPKSQEVIFYCA